MIFVSMVRESKGINSSSFQTDQQVHFTIFRNDEGKLCEIPFKPITSNHSLYKKVIYSPPSKIYF